jgi:hypothetical protein
MASSGNGLPGPFIQRANDPTNELTVINNLLPRT